MLTKWRGLPAVTPAMPVPVAVIAHMATPDRPT
ncbi:MAG: hypothetical protein RLZZ444_4686, partial [Pseudomonadota bacterium]